MTKEVRIEMCEARIGIGDPGFSANRLTIWMTDRGAISGSGYSEKSGRLPIADENDQVAEVFVVNNRNDPGLPPLPA